MNKLLSFATILFVVLAITACAKATVKQAYKPQETHVSDARGADKADSRAIKDKMYLQYQQWKGTRHAMGGLSKRGVDCSGFVYLTYREKLGVELPRSTKLQSQIGKKIKRSELRPGDLVFFKTGFKGRHVGIYIENGKFLHVSTRKGVMISSLSDYYWKDRYWHSRRVRL
ncbi:MAG: NlpC/P60 family protein [Thermodesulfobacteriota bacterium]